MSVIEKEALFVDIYNRFNHQFFNDTLRVFVSLGFLGSDLREDINDITCGYNIVSGVFEGNPAIRQPVLCIYSSEKNLDIASVLRLIFWAARNPKEIEAKQTIHAGDIQEINDSTLYFIPREDLKNFAPGLSIVDTFLAQKFPYDKLKRAVACPPLAYWYENEQFHVSDRIIDSGNSRMTPNEILLVKNLHDIRCSSEGNCVIKADNRYYFYSPKAKKRLDTISQRLLPGVEITGFGTGCLSLRLSYLKRPFVEVYYDNNSMSYLPGLSNKDVGWLYPYKKEYRHSSTDNLMHLPFLFIQLIFSTAIASIILYKVNSTRS
jgi:hypothetical protein